VFDVTLYTIDGRGLTEIDQNGVLIRLPGPTAEERPRKETSS